MVLWFSLIYIQNAVDVHYKLIFVLLGNTVQAGREIQKKPTQWDNEADVHGDLDLSLLAS